MVAVVASLLVVTGCIQAQPATDTGQIAATTPTGPSSVSSSPTPNPSPPVGSGPALSYDQDLKPIFNGDCVSCHSTSRPQGRYSMSTYAQVMAAVQPGKARSALVVTTQSNGSMYRYFSANRATKADLVRQWVVNFNAQQTR